ncbi:MAG TPA: allophanate hydrolase [Tepidisphaeraceae bacterium]|jgi:allophanate hydrolase|nr:allophanate hydrolase [Tepidisphaeraceae bacterium]
MTTVNRNSDGALSIQTLAARFRDGTSSPTAIIEECVARIEAHADPATWITLVPRESLLAQATAAEVRIKSGDANPLLGVPFAIKDNIDLANCKTTAACPDFAYLPARSAAVIVRLIEQGAIPVGKTNLDQFATGLVGVRSPYDTPRNTFDSRFIPGGSSSGSATAVSAGLVSFALGTDTAGSGRVPAAFNNIVGFKPTRGLLSTCGVVPACRSLDCVSIFALTCVDAAEVMRATANYDVQDSFSRAPDEIPARPSTFPPSFRFGVPSDDQLQFFGNADAQRIFRDAIRRLESLGGRASTINFAPFLAAGKLLYEGPWVAERMVALGKFIAGHPESLLPVTRQILQSSDRFDAQATFNGFHKLRDLHRATLAEWASMDVLLIPTTGTIYSISDIAEDPIRRNANLGYYTTFTNLLDLCAVAIPADIMGNGLPMGVTLMAPPGNDAALLDLGDQLHRSANCGTGAMKYAVPAISPQRPTRFDGDYLCLAVVGAHLSGQPLNWQLTNLNGRLIGVGRTTPDYRLYALANTTPPKPGLVRVADGAGAEIEVEVWELTIEAFGRFVGAIPPPMGICTLRLQNGGEVKGFTCEGFALSGAADITQFGGWRNYLASL